MLDARTTTRTVRARIGTGAALLALAAAVVGVAAWHLSQGTAETLTSDIVWGSRVPRLGAGLAVGFSLGVAGALFQSVARNALASPDTLAVTAGSYLAVVAVAAFGVGVPLWASGLTAFVGGLAAAALVMALAGGAGSSTTRLVLAGSAVALALDAAASMLLVLRQQETVGLFAWGSGSLSQLDLTAFEHAAPVIAAATLGGLLLTRRLDVLAMGDDAAGSLGVAVRRTRALGTALAVLLTAAAVTLAGPIGFVGLAAPAIARLLGRVVPGFRSHGALLPASGLLGALVVVLADALMRALLGAEVALQVPTGVTTTLLGAAILVVMARQARDAGPTRRPAAAGLPSRTRLRFVVVLTLAVTAAAGVALLGLLWGYTWLRTGDLALWASGDAPTFIRFALEERAPRVVAAVLAGGALGLSGCLVQATCRNPLAEPGILGITGGAGVGAVVVVTTGPQTTTAMLLAAVAGSLIAFAVVYGLSWRHGLDSDRLVLVGVGFSALAAGVSTFLLVRSDPWNTPRIYTWLSGTTYGRTWEQVLPVGVLLVVAVPVALAVRRELDLMGLDEDTPRLAGVPLERARLLVLTLGALLAAVSVAAVGVVGFVGLVAPHAARALVGGRHLRVVPVAVLLGAVVLGLSDAVGRSVIAPDQIPAGLIVALVGGPYFVYLLARSRA